MSESREEMLLAIGASNDERVRALATKRFQVTGHKEILLISLLETLLGGPGSDQCIEAYLLYEQRRAEALDHQEEMADEALARMEEQKELEAQATREIVASEESRRRRELLGGGIPAQPGRRSISDVKLKQV